MDYNEDSSQDEQDEQDGQPLASTRPVRDWGDDDEEWSEFMALASVKRTRKAQARQQKPFRFLDLPLELRTMVYKHCFDQMAGYYWIGELLSKKSLAEKGRRSASLNGLGKRSIDPVEAALYPPPPPPQHGVMGLPWPPRRPPPHPVNKGRSVNTRLLQTCKQVYHEGASILYGQRFKFSSLGALQFFLIRLDQRTISHLRDIELPTISEPTIFAPLVLSLLAPAINIKALRAPDVDSVTPKIGDETIGPVSWSPTMSVEDWDMLIARNMAKEVYSQMFPFLEAFLLRSASRRADHNKPGTPTAVAQLLGVLRVFEGALENGPLLPPPVRNNHIWGGYLWARTRRQTMGGWLDRREFCVRFGGSNVPAPRKDMQEVPWTAERGRAMREEMGEEILRLVREN